MALGITTLFFIGPGLGSQLPTIAACLASAVLPMALLPSDTQLVTARIGRAFLILATAYASVQAIKLMKMLKGGWPDCCSNPQTDFSQTDFLRENCWFTLLFAAVQSIKVLTFPAAAGWLYVGVWQQLSTVAFMERTWFNLGALLFCMFLGNVAATSGMVVAGLYPDAGAYGMLAVSNLAVVVFCFFGAPVRSKLQSWLASRGEDVSGAAGVAELIGRRPMEEVLSTARASFRYISAGMLDKDAMFESKPNAELAARSKPCRLGEADAFMSHSWSDNPELKWLSLQAWCEEFKASHRGREPKLWIDKYCIDQNNIEDSLACLPVYLAGCKKLIIFCGNTYLKRLWCLVEIFVFLEMGGKAENLQVHILNDRAEKLRRNSVRRNSVSRTCLTETMDTELSNFDPEAAQCFLEEDTMRLQAVIETTGRAKIQELVRDVFVNASLH